MRKEKDENVNYKHKEEDGKENTSDKLDNHTIQNSHDFKTHQQLVNFLDFFCLNIEKERKKMLKENKQQQQL